MSAITVHPANSGAKLSPKMSAILVSCMGGAIYGLASGIIGGVNDAIVKDRYFPNSSTSNQSVLNGLLVASILIGAFIGCFLGVDAGNRFGRRKAFRITGLLCVLFSVLLAVLPGFWPIVLARTALGMSVGFASALVPWYVTDAVDASVRGSIGTIFQINICGYILLAEIINYACHPDASKVNLHIPEWKWRLELGLSLVPGVLMTVLSFIMHESPVYLAQLTEQERLLGGAMTSVAGAGLSDDAELHSSTSVNGQLKDSNAVAAVSEPQASMRELFSGANLKWVAVGLILSGSQQLTGINAVIFYAPSIFGDANMGNPLVMTMAVVGTWNLLSVFISFALVDRLGRRTLMLSALTLMAVGSGFMAAAYKFTPDNKGPLAITALILFVGAFECGPGPLFFVMAVESFPPRLRDAALSITQSSCWVFSIMVTFGFPILNDALGSSATFLIFLINCIVSLALIWWKVPEPYQAGTDKDALTADTNTNSDYGAAYSPL